jgi:hypothetical protein
MKKILTFMAFLICFLFNVFGQTLKDYTPLTAGNIADAARLTATKYAAPCDIVTQTVQGQKLHVFQSGMTLIAFDLTAEQERQLDTIRNEKDAPLVLFTRRGTNRDNYRFVVDRLIPLKNVFGIVAGDLPRGFTSQDYYAVLDLYFQTPKPDPDGRVAEKVRQAQADATRVQEAARVEAARRLDASNREAFLNGTMVGGGYKPFIRQNSVSLSDIEPYEKIVVIGSSSGNQIKPTNINQYLYLRNPTDSGIIAELSDKRYELPREGREYPVLLFLTKSGRDYVLDRYVFYYDLIRDEPKEPYPTIKQTVLDTWIIDNVDR